MWTLLESASKDMLNKIREFTLLDLNRICH